MKQKERAIYLLKNHSKVLNNPKSIKNKLLNKSKKKVTIVTAAYNAEKYIQKCINSVVSQTFGFNNIEFIIIDDNSSDSTRDILIENAKKYKFTVVLLDENTGTASTPRNIGIELSTTEKIMFLDSDDWLHTDSIQTLSDIMDEDSVDVVIGKTIKVTDNGESIHAEFLSYKLRNQMNPFSVPYLFYYMGPQSKLIRTSIIYENNIRFPEIKFGEDKFFFLDVFINCSSISTLNATVCFLNRLSNNNESITKTVNIFKKRDSDIKLLNRVLDKGLKIDYEKTLVKRVLEYDLVRVCDSFTFTVYGKLKM